MMITSDTPNIWELKNYIGKVKTRAVLTNALLWLAELVNVERNLTDVQIAEIVNDLIENMGYLKIEEVKYVLKQAARSQKIYARLDYNVVMGWFGDYAEQRFEHAIRISDQEASQQQHATAVPDEKAMTYAEYLQSLERRIADGDKTAAAIKAEIDSSNPSKAVLTTQQLHDKEVSFKQWFYNNYSRNNGYDKRRVD